MINCSSAELLCQPVRLSNDLVQYHMSSAVQTIEHNCSLLDAGRNMCGQHIHRLIALDERSAPVGILSSLDIVATVISAVEE
jgi:predicted transcriptional regulator